MFLCIRYVDLNNPKLNKEFVQFVPRTDIKWKELGKLIIDNV